ncbi:hypothetical protein FPOAC2_02143 [Fusarium poae]
MNANIRFNSLECQLQKYKHQLHLAVSLVDAPRQLAVDLRCRKTLVSAGKERAIQTATPWLLYYSMHFAVVGTKLLSPGAGSECPRLPSSSTDGISLLTIVRHSFMAPRSSASHKGPTDGCL